MRLVFWLGDFHVLFTFERQQRKKSCVWVQQTKMSQCEKLSARESRIIREPAHRRTKLFKINFQCTSWSKKHGIEDVQAPVSCSCLSLLGETVIVYFCLSSGRTMWCRQTLSYVPLCVVSSYDGVLWDTVMCTSLSPRVSWCGVVRHCNVYLSLSPCLLVWCGETLQCAPLSFDRSYDVVLWDTVVFTSLCRQVYDVVLWDTVMCTPLCLQVVRCGAVRHCNLYLSLASGVMVLWDTVMCTSLCPRVLWCGAVRHCNVYLSVVKSHDVVLWGTVMCTALSSSLTMWCCNTL